MIPYILFNYNLTISLESCKYSKNITKIRKKMRLFLDLWYVTLRFDLNIPHNNTLQTQVFYKKSTILLYQCALLYLRKLNS